MKDHEDLVQKVKWQHEAIAWAGPVMGERGYLQDFVHHFVNFFPATSAFDRKRKAVWAFLKKYKLHMNTIAMKTKAFTVCLCPVPRARLAAFLCHSQCAIFNRFVAGCADDRFQARSLHGRCSGHADSFQPGLRQVERVSTSCDPPQLR
jgi:hypothetical protein